MGSYNNGQQIIFENFQTYKAVIIDKMEEKIAEYTAPTPYQSDTESEK